MSVINPTKVEYEVVIGIEVHVQLKTQTKLFCACSAQFGGEQNQNTCPVCLAMPGVLPVLNRQAVEYGILTGLALNCRIANITKFDRKQYFYPDLPKGYQISQFDQPLCEGGYLDVMGQRVGITRAHLEEDAGKLVHAGADRLAGSTHSLVDLNRAGVPLLEIVSEPDIRSSEQARVYVETLRSIVRYLGVCDGNLEEGSMRADANVSVRPKGQAAFGTKAEIKNMNSFRSIQRGIDYEVSRQIEVVESGGKVIQESRLWDENTGVTKSMRSKEEAHDYRYFPEPDLRPLLIAPDWVEQLKASMPELPHQRLERLQQTYGLSEYDASVLVEFKELGDFFLQTLEQTKHAKAVANWLMGDITGWLKNQGQDLAQSALTPKALAELVELIEQQTISNAIAKKILPALMTSGKSPQAIVDEQGLAQVTDDAAIRQICEQVIAENAGQVAEYRSGKDKLFGFFVGQVMKASKGTANPDKVNELMKALLKG